MVATADTGSPIRRGSDCGSDATLPCQQLHQARTGSEARKIASSVAVAIAASLEMPR